jgi:hypothetical protein
MVVVALGEPGVPVTCWAQAGAPTRASILTNEMTVRRNAMTGSPRNI